MAHRLIFPFVSHIYKRKMSQWPKLMRRSVETGEMQMRGEVPYESPTSQSGSKVPR